MKRVYSNFGTLRKDQIYELHAYKKMNPRPMSQIREENFPEVREDIFIKLQETHKTPKTEKKSPWHIIFKRLKIAKEERVLKATKGKQQPYKNNSPHSNS